MRGGSFDRDQQRCIGRRHCVLWQNADCNVNLRAAQTVGAIAAIAGRWLIVCGMPDLRTRMHAAKSQLVCTEACRCGVKVSGGESRSLGKPERVLVRRRHQLRKAGNHGETMENSARPTSHGASRSIRMASRYDESRSHEVRLWNVGNDCIIKMRTLSVLSQAIMRNGIG